jgi:hypothetical protein
MDFFLVLKVFLSPLNVVLNRLLKFLKFNSSLDIYLNDIFLVLNLNIYLINK